MCYSGALINHIGGGGKLGDLVNTDREKQHKKIQTKLNKPSCVSITPFMLKCSQIHLLQSDLKLNL